MINTFGQTFIYQDKYIQIDIAINSEHVFGFGERLSKFKLEEGAWTMWPQDSEKVEVDAGSGGKQLEGMHPFCLIKAQTTNEYLGMYFRSTNAQAPVLRRNGTSTILSYITTGGSLDINFFFRGSAKEVIANY
jgi:alpha-glucosidase (family GH31 glycosyl hydrolase)